MQEEFVSAMSHLAYPVSIVSSQANENRFAITVSSVTSVSVEPPSLLICINKVSSIAETIVIGSFININFLRPEQKSIASICSSKEKAGERFKYDAWAQDKNNTPYLEDSASIAFCSVMDTIEYATHIIAILNVDDVTINQSKNLDPLLYSNRKFIQLT